LINSINIGYQKENRNRRWLLQRNVCYGEARERHVWLYEGLGEGSVFRGQQKRSNTRYSIWISPEWLCWYCGTYII
jgi:hypothetical protein